MVCSTASDILEQTVYHSTDLIDLNDLQTAYQSVSKRATLYNIASNGGCALPLPPASSISQDLILTRCFLRLLVAGCMKSVSGCRTQRFSVLGCVPVDFGIPDC